MENRKLRLLDAIKGMAFQYTGQDLEVFVASGFSDAKGDRKLIETLARSAARFLRKSDGDGLYAGGFSAAEDALCVLEAYGLMQRLNTNVGEWTELGRQALSSK
ncbi:hypothetical protein [Beijerinckia sp. L45]|uniref:hypothetical protein n=1 Tax=Beijerinckia sp. L45 TaxID=1641855 RepID=UPI00131D3F5F|nr:hypothetical protein [Beijerinckia sp. L45]